MTFYRFQWLMLYTTVIIIYTYRFSKSINILGKFCMPYQHHINIRRGSQEATVESERLSMSRLPERLDFLQVLG